MQMQLDALILSLINDLDLVYSRDRARVDDGVTGKFIEFHITGNDDSGSFFNVR